MKKSVTGNTLKHQIIRYLKLGFVVTIVSTMLVFFIKKATETPVPSYTIISTKYNTNLLGYKIVRIKLLIQGKIDTVESLKKMMYSELNLRMKDLTDDSRAYLFFISAHLKGPYASWQWVAFLRSDAQKIDTAPPPLKFQVNDKLLLNYNIDQGEKFGLSTLERKKVFLEWSYYSDKAGVYEVPLKYPDPDLQTIDYQKKLNKIYDLREPYREKLRKKYYNAACEKYGINEDQYFRIRMEGRKLDWPMGSWDWFDEPEKALKVKFK